MLLLLANCTSPDISEPPIGVEINSIELNGEEGEDGETIELKVKDVSELKDYKLEFDAGSNTSKIEVDVDGEKDYDLDEGDDLKIFQDIDIEDKTYTIKITPYNEDDEKGDTFTIKIKVIIDDGTSSKEDSSSSEKDDSSSSEKDSSSSEKDDSSSSEKDSSSSEKDDSSSSEKDSSSSEKNDSSSSEKDSSSSEKDDSSSSEDQPMSSVEDGQLYPIEFEDGIVFNGQKGLRIETEKSEVSLDGDKLVVTWDKGSDPRGEPIPNSFMFDFGKITDVSQYKSIKFKYTSEVPVKMWLVWGASIDGSTIYQYDVKPGGGADYYFLPAGLDEEIELSLAGNFHNGQVINALENLDITKLRHIGFKTHYDYTATVKGGETITFEDFRFDEEEVMQDFKRETFRHDTKGYVWIGQEQAGIDDFLALPGVVVPSGFMSYFSMWEWNYGWDETEETGQNINLRKYSDNPQYDNMTHQIAIGLWLEGFGGNGCQKIANNWQIEWETSYDDYVQLHLDLLSDRIKGLKAPVFLRLNHEFDNPNHGCGSAQDLGNAIKTIAEYFHMRGVKNVSYTLHKWQMNSQAADQVSTVFGIAGDYIGWFGGSWLGGGEQNEGGLMSISGDRPTMIAETDHVGSLGIVSETDMMGASFISSNLNLGGWQFNSKLTSTGEWNNYMNNGKLLKQSDMKFTYTEMGGIDMNW